MKLIIKLNVFGKNSANDPPELNRLENWLFQTAFQVTTGQKNNDQETNFQRWVSIIVIKSKKSKLLKILSTFLEC